MAELIILTPEQLAERAHRPTGQGRVGRRRSPERMLIIEAYKAALQDAQPGYGADVRLEAGDEKRTVRQNLKAAAEELNVALDFRPIRDPNRIHFRVITPEEQAARPKRGGRPRQSAGEAQAAQQAPPVVAPEAPVELPKKRGRRPRTAANHEAAA